MPCGGQFRLESAARSTIMPPMPHARTLLPLMLAGFCALPQLACQQATEAPQQKSLAELLLQTAQENRQKQQAPPTPQDNLFLAIDEGNMAEVKHWIEHGAELNAPDNYNNTPLRTAAAQGHNDIVLALLAAGADVNQGAPLLGAVGRNRREMVQLLLKHGADVDQMEDDPLLGTPLNYAASEGHEDIVRDLLVAGADVNKKAKQGDTPLIQAVKEHHTRLVPLLLQAGADVNAADARNITALWHAASDGDLETARILIEAGADANARSTDHGSILEAAALHAESAEMVRLLLRHGAERRLNPGLVESYLHPDCSFEIPSDKMLDALEAAGYNHGISRDKTQQQRLEERLQQIRPLNPDLYLP